MGQQFGRGRVFLLGGMFQRVDQELAYQKNLRLIRCIGRLHGVVGETCTLVSKMFQMFYGQTVDSILKVASGALHGKVRRA